MSTSSTSGKLVGVFCGARDGNSTVYNEAATQLGAELAKANYGLIYGGGSRGLMGSVARSVHENSGEVVSAMPKIFANEDTGVDFGSKVVVESIAECKKVVAERAVAYVAMPGGFGVVDELFEALALKAAGQHSKTIVVLNTDGYFEGIREFLNHTVNQGFVDEGKRDIVVFCSSPKEAIEAITAAKTSSTD